MTQRAQGGRWKSTWKAFSRTSRLPSISILSTSTSDPRVRKVHKTINKHQEEHHETPRLHQVERRARSHDGGHDATVVRICSNENGAEGIGRPSAGLSDGRSRRPNGQEAGNRHQRPADDPDVPLDAARRRKGNDRASPT